MAMLRQKAAINIEMEKTKVMGRIAASGADKTIVGMETVVGFYRRWRGEVPRGANPTTYFLTIWAEGKPLV